MKNPGRDLLVLMKHDFINEHAIDREVESLNRILQQIETPHQFCIAHELVDRNYITSSVRRLLDVIHCIELKPFRFLINKN